MGPSAELKPPAPGRGRIADAAWWLLFAMAVTAILGGAWRSVEQLRHPTGLDRTGLMVQSARECVRLAPRTHLARALWPATINDVQGGCVVAVDGTDVPLAASPATVAKLLDGPADTFAAVTLVHESGAIAHAQFRRVAVGGWYDAGLLLLDLLVAALYAAAALLLRLRRRSDPVARRMSLAFVMIVHICNGPIAFWEWAQWSISYLLALAGFLLITVTLPAYPDGAYVPRATRWIRVVVPVATVAVFVAGTFIHGLSDWYMKGILGLVAMGVGLLVMRYRRMPAGLPKQQVKWAVFGLSAGLLLIILSAQVPKPPALAQSSLDLFNWLTRTGAVVNQIGYGLIPAGILISLLEYRLNDADAAVSKSLGYTIVTLIVGIVWAIVQSVVGNYAKLWFPDPLATTAITTAIAALVFTPARSHVLAWTERRFQPALVRLRQLPDKLVRWQTCQTPDELAGGVLADLVDGVGAAYAAVLGDDGRDWRVLAVNGIEPQQAMARLDGARPAERRFDPFPIRLELSDQVGRPDLLAVGPRSDGASFTSDEKSAIALIVGPLSNALQAAALRERHAIKMEAALAAIDERLVAIERELRR